MCIRCIVANIRSCLWHDDELFGCIAIPRTANAYDIDTSRYQKDAQSNEPIGQNRKCKRWDARMFERSSSNASANQWVVVALFSTSVEFILLFCCFAVAVQCHNSLVSPISWLWWSLDRWAYVSASRYLSWRRWAMKCFRWCGWFRQDDIVSAFGQNSIERVTDDNCRIFVYGAVSLHIILHRPEFTFEFNGIKWMAVSIGLASISCWRSSCHCTYDDASTTAILYEHLRHFNIEFGKFRWREYCRMLSAGASGFVRINFPLIDSQVLRGVYSALMLLQTIEWILNIMCSVSTTNSIYVFYNSSGLIQKYYFQCHVVCFVLWVGHIK